MRLAGRTALVTGSSRGITLNAVEPGMTLSREAPPQAAVDKVARWLTGLSIPATSGQVASAMTIFACDK